MKNDFLLWTWLILFISSGGSPSADALLQENGDFLLQESGDKILL